MLSVRTHTYVQTLILRPWQELAKQRLLPKILQYCVAAKQTSVQYIILPLFQHSCCWKELRIIPSGENLAAENMYRFDSSRPLLEIWQQPLLATCFNAQPALPKRLLCIKVWTRCEFQHNRVARTFILITSQVNSWSKSGEIITVWKNNQLVYLPALQFHQNNLQNSRHLFKIRWRNQCEPCH